MISKINILKGLDGFIQKLLNMSPMIKPYSRCIPSLVGKKEDHAWCDSHTTKQLGVGDVLKTPKNLVYDFLSSKGSLKQVIEFDQYILSNKGLFLKKKNLCL